MFSVEHVLDDLRPVFFQVDSVQYGLLQLVARYSLTGVQFVEENIYQEFAKLLVVFVKL